VIRRIVMVLGLAAVCAVAVVGSAGGQAPPVGLANVKAACENSFTSTSPGIAEVANGLRDADVTIAIGVPCLVRLAPSASVKLSNVKITSHILNLVDDAHTGGKNEIALENVSLTGGADAGFLVELRDPEDSFYARNSSLDYPLGVVLKVLGHRGDENAGGSIRMERTSLSAATEDGEGVALVASEHSGTIELLQPTISTPSAVLVVAGDCEANVAGNKVDCSTDALAENIERQARELNP
jgi:hypothetical protein